MFKWRFYYFFFSFNLVFSLIELRYFFHYVNDEVRIYSGSEKYKAYIGLDLTSEYTWLCFEKREQYLSNTSILSTDLFQFSYFDDLYQGLKVDDIFQLDELLPVNLTFVIASRVPERSIFQKQGSLGLAYSFSSPNLSIMHMLKAKGIIDSLSFAFRRQFAFFLGGLPQEDTIDRLHSSCDVLGRNNSWNCAISLITITKGIKVINYPIKDSYITFNADKEINYVPKEFFELLQADFYKGELENGTYRISTVNNKRQIYSLDDERKEGIITFVLGEYAYTVTLDKFWYCYEIACDLNILQNPFGDYWVFGMNFFNEHNVLFDYDEGKIHFYSKQGVTHYHHQSTYLLIGLLVVNMLMMSIGSGGLFMSKRKCLMNHKENIQYE